jgi:uncharacterized protein DUF397
VIRWRKSSHSEGNVEGTCVEVADLAGPIAIRDSKNPHGPRLEISPRAFAALLADVRRHQF